MKALISPIEPRETGYRVAQIDSNGFDVAQPFFWMECDDTIVADVYYYDPADQTFKEVPIPVVPEVVTSNNQPTTTGSQTL
jgi:hypothetical protein